MITLPTYFSLDELVCEDVYNTYGKKAWMFFDPRLLITLDTIRDRIGKPIFVNNWQIHGTKDERGLRCFRCPEFKKHIENNEMYMSAHLLGKAVDFDVEGLLAEEVRLWIVAKRNWWPYHIRLEKGTTWVHLDTFDYSEDKVYIFEP